MADPICDLTLAVSRHRPEAIIRDQLARDLGINGSQHTRISCE